MYGNLELAEIGKSPERDIGRDNLIEILRGLYIIIKIPIYTKVETYLYKLEQTRNRFRRVNG